jgi:AIR synthase related protein, N-terminal domain
VQTVDFLTPVTDDPFMYGQIAAANSLSDVYAMGGEPISALSILAYPSSGDFEVLERIVRGGLATMEEANCSLVGGHSIADEEMKFGYAVTGPRMCAPTSRSPGSIRRLPVPPCTPRLHATRPKRKTRSSRPMPIYSTVPASTETSAPIATADLITPRVTMVSLFIRRFLNS